VPISAIGTVPTKFGAYPKLDEYCQVVPTRKRSSCRHKERENAQTAPTLSRNLCSSSSRVSPPWPARLP